MLGVIRGELQHQACESMASLTEPFGVITRKA